MKKIMLFTIFATLTALVALITYARASSRKELALGAPRQDQGETLVCGNWTLDGAYGLTISGTRPAPPPPSGTPNYVPGTIEQLIGVGTRTFDGAGNFTQVTNEKGSLSGILFINRAAQGTYSVNPDCSGTITLNIPGLPFPIVNDFVIVNQGKEFHAIVASPQTAMVSTTGQKE